MTFLVYSLMQLTNIFFPTLNILSEIPFLADQHLSQLYTKKANTVIQSSLISWILFLDKEKNVAR